MNDKRFVVLQKAHTRNLCQGRLIDFLGEKEGLLHYKSEIEITFSGKNKKLIGEVAISENRFYLAITSGRMLNLSDQVEWIDPTLSKRAEIADQFPKGSCNG